MSTIFFEILNNSIAAGYLIIAVLLLRLILKKAPKWSICLLWAMVAIRLVMPFEIESELSLLPDFKLFQMGNRQNTSISPVKPEQKDEIWEEYIQNHQNIQQQNKNQQAVWPNQNNLEDSMENDMEAGYEILFVSRVRVISFIWLAGSLGLVIYALISFLRLKRKVSAAIPLYDNVYLCDDIESPFVMGIFKPCIYLSSGTTKESWNCILKHEKAHIKRGDHIWKLLGYALLVIYWFHPLSWVSYILFCKDIELACDEKATKDMDKNERADYCKALLTCSINRKKVDVCPVAFGEVGVKERIKQVLNYKKPSFWVMALAAAVCIIVPVCFLTNPKKEESFLKYLDMSYGEYQKETEKEAEFLHGAFFVGKLGAEGIKGNFSGKEAEIVYAGEYKEELAGYELSENSMPVRIQGDFCDLVELDAEQFTEAELVKNISEQYGDVVSTEYCEGAGTAYYVSDFYIRILVDLKEAENTNIIFEVAVEKQNGSEKVFLADADTWISREKDEENIREKDENGYIWLSDEVYIYEYEDLDKNGIKEYAKVYQIDTEQEYICRYIFYWNGEAVYEYENSYGMSPGEAEYLDLDGDGEKEIFLTFCPHVNSMPLGEYIVLKQKNDMSWESLEMIHGEEMYDNAFPIFITKGKNEWEAVISCEGLEKTVSFDIAYYHGKLLELRENVDEEKDYLSALINDYKYGFPETSEWYTFGSVCAWGIWEIKSGEYQGQPCLIATHGIQGYDKFDFWGELDVYFNYNAEGKTRFLDMEFRNSVSWDDTGQQTKKEFTMEELISLCDAGSEELRKFFTELGKEEELSYDNFEKKENDVSLTWSYQCTLPYQGEEYMLQVIYWKPATAEEYGHKENELDYVSIFSPVVGDGQLLYEADERFIPNLDIRSFLDREYSLEPYVELDLPDTLKFGNFRTDLTIGREGCLFQGDYEEPFHGDGTPEDWYTPGGIEFIEQQYFSFTGNVIFEEGKLKEVAVLQNHSSFDSEFEYIEGCDMQAVLCEAYFDLFTAAEAEEYMNEYGISEEEFPWHSRYWYVFFAEEDSKYVYMLFLNQEYFDKEDMVKLARSAKFKVK